MIKRKNEHTQSVKDRPFGAEGQMKAVCLTDSPEELYGKGRLFNIVTLEPGCGVGYHVHKGDGEFYHILSGEGEYSDNGVPTVLREGDTSFCPDGEGHSFVNTGSETLRFVALILYS